MEGTRAGPSALLAYWATVAMSTFDQKSQSALADRQGPSQSSRSSQSLETLCGQDVHRNQGSRTNRKYSTSLPAQRLPAQFVTAVERRRGRQTSRHEEAVEHCIGLSQFHPGLNERQL